MPGVTLDLGAAWLAAMRRGDFASCWSISDEVLAQRVANGPCWHLPRHEQWVWDGRPLEGKKVLVRCYHGLGDTIQFARFLPALGAMAREVVVWAPAPLLPLLRNVDCALGLLALHDGTPEVDYDVDIEIMELGHALRIDAAALPGPVPYVHVRAAGRFSDTFSVGLVARAGEWDVSRDVPAQQLGRVWPNGYSLQLGTPIPGTVDASTPDMMELAARINALDLVISVDTMVAHLAGALGVPVWTLLKADADWRWMADRSDSPWYPTMRLFRQRRPGNWDDVLDEVRAEVSRCTH